MVNLTAHLTVGSNRFTPEQVLDLLHQYRLMPALLREILIDEAIADIQLTTDEEQAIIQGLQKNQPNPQTPDSLNQLTRSQNWEFRKAKIEKFKQQTWGNKIEDYFLGRKSQLDRAVYHLLRHKEHHVIQELYFRLQEGEKTFVDLVPLFSDGSEVHTKGLIGPVEMGKLNPVLAHLLRTSHPGQILAPVRLGDWWVIVELVEWLPAQLNEGLRRQFLTEFFEQWLNARLQKELQANPNRSDHAQ